MELMRAVIEIGLGFFVEEFMRNVDRYGIVGTFHKKSRGRHCKQGRSGRYERVRNAMISRRDRVLKKDWPGQHSLVTTGAYLAAAPYLVEKLVAERTMALDGMMKQLSRIQVRVNRQRNMATA